MAKVAVQRQPLCPIPDGEMTAFGRRIIAKHTGAIDFAGRRDSERLYCLHRSHTMPARAIPPKQKLVKGRLRPHPQAQENFARRRHDQSADRCVILEQQTAAQRFPTVTIAHQDHTRPRLPGSLETACEIDVAASISRHRLNVVRGFVGFTDCRPLPAVPSHEVLCRETADIRERAAHQYSLRGRQECIHPAADTTGHHTCALVSPLVERPFGMVGWLADRTHEEQASFPQHHRVSSARSPCHRQAGRDSLLFPTWRSQSGRRQNPA